MERRAWPARVGRLESGEYAGMFVEVEGDASGGGYHISLSSEHPRAGPSGGWDIWADSADDVNGWFRPRLIAVGGFEDPPLVRLYGQRQIGRFMLHEISRRTGVVKP